MYEIKRLYNIHHLFNNEAIQSRYQWMHLNNLDRMLCSTDNTTS